MFTGNDDDVSFSDLEGDADISFVRHLLEKNPLFVFGEGEYGVTDIFYATARSKNHDGAPPSSTRPPEKENSGYGDSAESVWALKAKEAQKKVQGGGGGDEEGAGKLLEVRESSEGGGKRYDAED
ncbi:Uncharacterized protein Rs2_04808 [Raphanus sativus]|nr:Uncharacterized protein Rs2_04808 [Raphanus sativus]